MIVADTDLMAWLETVPDTRPVVMVPYVKSRLNATIQYQLTATRRGVTGLATIKQSGNLQLKASTPAQLTRFSLSVGSQDDCKIELVLFSHGNTLGTYQFACPRLQ
ncbi:MAG TPA: curli-like amyloid fiber formation chaperone CsgH [Castellaniella sp.]|uniref:curli-like amyloid fiber formation chaperone CsgH n=1 Tax=Castellaniella sp. TaxID=1955812 RepID=UPI002F0988C2